MACLTYSGLLFTWNLLQDGQELLVQDEQAALVSAARMYASHWEAKKQKRLIRLASNQSSMIKTFQNCEISKFFTEVLLMCVPHPSGEYHSIRHHKA